MSTIPNFPVDTANTLYATRSRVAFKPTDGVKTGATGTAATDVIAIADHTFLAGDMVEFTAGTGFTGLTVGSYYFVRDVVAATSFKVAATATGAAVDITVDGTAGTFSLLIGYETAKVDDESQAPSAERIEMPDDLGVYHPIRTDYGAQAESWSFTSYEITRLKKFFGGALQGVRRGVAKLWIPDAAMAAAGSTDPFLESEWFPAVVTRGGNVSYGDKKHSVATIKIESQKQGAVLFP